MLPMFGIKASMKLALVPFVNISLLFNNALSSTIDPSFVLLTFVSTIVYAILLIMIISKIYNQEDILFNSKALSYIKFTNGKTRAICFSVTASLLIAVIILVLSYYFSFIFIKAPKYVLLSITPLTIFLVVAIASILIKLDFKNSFKLNGFKINKLLSYIMIYVSTYILSSFIIELFAKLFPSIVEKYGAYAELLSVDNLWLSILTIALLPAVFEELLFRGVIFNSFNKKYDVVIAVFVSALLFGVYHMNWIQGIYAFIFGLALAYMYFKSNSLFVPIIFHFINNLISTLVTYYDLVINIDSIFNIFFILSAIGLLILAIYICEKKE